ncbi:MAG: prolipoprotein diacylglyceryl transferase [Calditrichaceae bacterium]|nr:prolipoprotein diacylglyceryl transferase [Calditrichia bacterium]NUQ41349.1 prolipoprotein diacylglyceryl transferase [Calditrichaceae bacterium]
MEWNVSPEIFRIGPIALRWYSLMFILSFLLGYYLVRKMFLAEKKPEQYMDALFLYMFGGTIIGARLGHCLFYDPVYYLTHPLEIFAVWQGGLASHGATIGIIIAVYLFSQKRKETPFLWTLDRVAIVVALAGFFIRLGNLFNSEIVGAPTTVPWAFIFPRYEQDPVPRHPAQLYEAIAYLLVFIFLFLLYRRTQANTRHGLIVGIFLVLVFGFRFFVEFFKEVQESWEASLPLDMGQLLSIPAVLLGLYLIKTAKPPVVQKSTPTGKRKKAGA